MKKALVLSVLLVVALSGAVLAEGPVFGFGIEPTSGAVASFEFGWGFDSWMLLGEKEAFNSWYGPWAISALWNPDLGWAAGRVGAELGWVWEQTGVYFDDLAFVLGVQRFWGIAGVYGQIEIGQSTYLVPKVGFELRFDLPQEVEP
jgi:hypothetical protein